jgi:hypothetical protein
MKRALLIATIMVFGFAAPAEAHHPGEGYSNQRVLETNYDGSCGSGISVCARHLIVDCHPLFGEHSRLCYGRYMAWTPASTHLFTCDWWGRVEHSGRVVTHDRRC